jgi:SRSO17 transposase
VTAALWTGLRAWFVGAELYLPEAWLTPERRAAARIPARRGFAEKWRLGLRLVQQVRAAGVAIEAVVADASYGNVVALRAALDRMHLPFVMGIRADTTVFTALPTVRPHQPQGRRRARGPCVIAATGTAVSTVAMALPPDAWHTISWRNGTQPRWRAQFAAIRVCPVASWRGPRRLDTYWVLCERGLDAQAPRFYLSNLPATCGLSRLARLAHQRWAIEQQYSDLKTELGIDHFEGRTYPGWHHHVVLSAIAYAFLQRERMRRREGPTLTFPQIRAIVQEVFVGLLYISRPKYLDWLNAGRRHLQMRI